MAQGILNNGDLGLDFRTKINDNFTELYALHGTLTSMTTATRNALTPSAGWVVFNSDVQKAQIYVDDTGLAAGGASNATPGWYDMY